MNYTDFVCLVADLILTRIFFLFTCFCSVTYCIIWSASAAESVAGSRTVSGSPAGSETERLGAVNASLSGDGDESGSRCVPVPSIGSTGEHSTMPAAQVITMKYTSTFSLSSIFLCTSAIVVYFQVQTQQYV